jgi:hypothetical protein
MWARSTYLGHIRWYAKNIIESERHAMFEYDLTDASMYCKSCGSHSYGGKCYAIVITYDRGAGSAGYTYGMDLVCGGCCKAIQDKIYKLTVGKVEKEKRKIAKAEQKALRDYRKSVKKVVKAMRFAHV